MMIKYVKYQNKATGSKAYEKWYLRAVQDEMIDLEQLADHMAGHSSPFTSGTLLGVLKDTVRCIKELLLEGKAVKMQDLAIFRLGLECKGAATAEEAVPANVTGVRINAMGTGVMAVATLKSEIRMTEARHYSSGEAEQGAAAGGE